MPAEPVQDALVTEAARSAVDVPMGAEAAPEPALTAAETAAPAGEAGHELVRDDLLVEDVSIDGMCGVY